MKLFLRRTLVQFVILLSKNHHNEMQQYQAAIVAVTRNGSTNKLPIQRNNVSAISPSVQGNRMISKTGRLL
jgi:hypothetical protein